MVRKLASTHLEDIGGHIMPNVILTVKNIAKYFDDKKVLKDISLQVNEGDVIAVVGSSGSGKSTFLRCINLLEEPDRGELSFKGEPYFRVKRCKEDFIDLVAYQKAHDNYESEVSPIREEYHALLSKKRSNTLTKEDKIQFKNIKNQYRLKKKETPNINSFFDKNTYKSYIKDNKPFIVNEKTLEKIRSNMVMVFQNFNLFNNMDVLSNCMFPLLHVKGMNKEEAKKIALEKLEMVNMLTHLYVRPRTLSGGQKQRVAIARSLCMNPSLILFDEPTSALDPQMVNEVLDIMKDLASKGMTMIVVTHEMNFAKNAANKVMYMDDGYVVEYASSKDFFNNPQNEKTKKFLSIF